MLLRQTTACHLSEHPLEWEHQSFEDATQECPITFLSKASLQITAAYTCLLFRVVMDGFHNVSLNNATLCYATHKHLAVFLAKWR